MDDFVDSISRTEEGIAEVEDFVNIEDVDVHIHKRLLEMAPDILQALVSLEHLSVLCGDLRISSPRIMK